MTPAPLGTATAPPEARVAEPAACALPEGCAHVVLYDADGSDRDVSVDHIEIECSDRGAVEDCRNTPDYHQVDAVFGQDLKCVLEPRRGDHYGRPSLVCLALSMVFRLKANVDIPFVPSR